MRNAIIFSFILLAGYACKVNKNQSTAIEKIILPDMVVKPNSVKNPVVFQGMEPHVVDLLHTTLYLNFDYQNQWVYGKAKLKMVPYLPVIKHFELDAVGFGLNQVLALKGKDTLAIDWDYNKEKIRITLKKDWFEHDTLDILIDYIAKPNELKAKEGKAITDSRGLYFINPLGTDPNKPRQIWSQGETEFNSCWFPTIDAPNEKHTQDLYLTVDSADVTLSNGLLLGSKREKNGLRTDHWQQLKPHAPYLTMVAIGDFRITKETWRNKEVSYYLEPAYAPYAKVIFGKTPQMLEVFSQITGVEYPWDKFSQIICRDFVSGAMENTSAVLHGEMVQHSTREHQDNPREDIIAHELFHHWFGDLVTCRSWSNLPLNESFATYGEYLYHEKVYGKEFADFVFSHNLSAYLNNKKKYKVSPIRNYYEEADEVFDVVSYQKGGWILHHLRNTIGDAAFFKGINIYLTENAYQCTDIDDLRHAMEKASGKDLQVFFKQWYHGFGHPELSIEMVEAGKPNKYLLKINQVQDSSFGYFDLNMQLFTLWSDGKSQMVPIHLSKESEIILVQPEDTTNLNKQLVSYWLDPNGNFLGTLKEKKTKTGWLKQLQTGIALEQYQTVMRATKVIGQLKYDEKSNIHQQAIADLLNSPKQYYQLLGVDLLETTDTLFAQFEPKLVQLAQTATYFEVRENAYYLLGTKGNKEQMMALLLGGLKDSSYSVIATCLNSLSVLDETLSLEKCKTLESEPSAELQRSIAWLYANYANEDKNSYFKQHLGKHGFYRNSILNAYGKYLSQQNANTLSQGISELKGYYALNSDRGKAAQMATLLKNIQVKSEAKAVFETELFKSFAAQVEKDKEDK